MKTRHGLGFTLLEVMMVIAVTGILLAVAVPNYNKLLQRQQLRQVAEMLAQDLRHARELSVSSNSAIYISYSAGKQWCWGVSRGQACDCSGRQALPARCSVSAMDSKDFPHVVLDIAQDAAFSPGLGQVAQTGAAAFRSKDGQNLRVVLGAMGRAQICGPDAPRGQACL